MSAFLNLFFLAPLTLSSCGYVSCATRLARLRTLFALGAPPTCRCSWPARKGLSLNFLLLVSGDRMHVLSLCMFFVYCSDSSRVTSALSCLLFSVSNFYFLSVREFLSVFFRYLRRVIATGSNPRVREESKSWGSSRGRGPHLQYYCYREDLAPPNSHYSSFSGAASRRTELCIDNL